MDDPRFWLAYGILCGAFALAAVMMTYRVISL